MIVWQSLQSRKLTHQLGFRDSLNGQSNGLFAALGETDQLQSRRIKTKGDTLLSKVLPEVVLIAS